MNRMLISLGLAGSLFLTACGGRVAVPTTITQTAPVAVAVPCLKPGQRPSQPTRLVTDLPVPPDTLTEMVGRLRAKLKEWQDSYGPSADDLLQICERIK